MIVDRGANYCAAGDGRGSRVTSVRKIEIGTGSRIVVRRFVPLVHARQNVRGSQTSIMIVYIVVERVRNSPQRDVVVHAVACEVVRRRSACARVQPVRETGRFVPTHRCRWLGSTAGVLRDLQGLRGIKFRDHVIRHFILAQSVSVTHCSGWIRSTRRIGRITGVPDVHEIHRELIATAAKRDEASGCITLPKTAN